MDHESAKLKLFEFIDGELAGEEADQVRNHVATCPECSVDAQFWKGASQSFRSDFVFPVPLGFSDRIMARIRESHSPKTAGSWLTDLLSLPRWETLAAAASLLLVFSDFIADRAQVYRSLGEEPAAILYNSKSAEQELVLGREIGREDLLAEAGFDE